MSSEADLRTPERAADGARALELYASAVVATRHYYGELARAEPPVSELEYVAECIAREAPNPGLSIALSLASAFRDDAARAVQSAFIAVRVARRATDHDRDLVGVALAALLVDAGRARLASASSLDLDVFSALPDSLNLLAPAATAALGVGGSHSPLREGAALTAFEVAWLERPRLGALYKEQLGPRLLSRVLLCCRALFSRIAPRTQDVMLSPFEALHQLCREPGADALALSLLADAVGRVPVGTVVELASGEWGVVSPELPRDPRQPVLAGLVDAQGRARNAAPRIELSPRPGAGIVRVIEPREARINAAYPLVTAMADSEAAAK